MSKMDNLRAMREARYDKAAARAKQAGGAKPPRQPLRWRPPASPRRRPPRWWRTRVPRSSADTAT